MKELTNVRARYEKPMLKFFRVSLEATCCQALSNPPMGYPGTGLGEDFDYFEF